MSQRKGTISVNTNDIFPIIKKWLYSDHDIFLRELVSNASDAITKRKTLSLGQNLEVPAGEVIVEIDKQNKKLLIIDNGLGMTETEVEKYLAQLAFSGAREFAEKMQKVNGEKGQGEDIIGKFGLGFYSAFMVSEKVEVDTLSMESGAKPIIWSCDGETEYSFSESQKTTVGTTITLHIKEDSKEFLEFYKVRSVLSKYCDFMPYPIELRDLEKIAQDQESKESKDDSVVEAPKKDIINQTTPLWKKDPSTLKDEDYIEFYRHLFPMDPNPLFWLHVKVDHPFELKGILYFPKLNPNKPLNESNIRLYCKQVFVSDNVKKIIPDFLSLLKGAIDSSEIPLNVSRSSLQGDPNISKISNYIVKKVAESLKKLFKKDRQKYEQVWDDIGLFVKYGAISEEKFDEDMRSMVLFKNLDGKLLTLDEYQSQVPEELKDKFKENKTLYFEKNKGDVSIKEALLEKKVPAFETDGYIDPHFMQHVEFKKVKDQSYKFSSIDSAYTDLFTPEKSSQEEEAVSQKVKNLFLQFLAPEKLNEVSAEEEKEKKGFPGMDGGLDIEVASINKNTAAFFKVDEQSKRLKQMTKSMGSLGMDMPLKKTLILNPKHPLINNTLKIWEKGENQALVEKMCHHVHDLANFSGEGLTQEEKEKFVKRSQDLVQELSNFVV